VAAGASSAQNSSAPGIAGHGKENFIGENFRQK
jgi:hypothetical protein